ncbi:MAG: DUF1109 domain-containing protein [Rhodospirillales bacterium]|nr:DUF1109 domain-containing protein [Rhodospirillales bacterium]
METKHVIDALVADLEPVDRLAPPWRRLATWLAFALPVVALVAAAMGLRADVVVKFTDPLFVAQEIMMIATAVIGGWAALSAGIPGTRRWILWLPAVPLLAWLSTMGYQWWQEWTSSAPNGMEFGLSLHCPRGIAIAGIVPVVAMIAMVRKGSRLDAWVSVFWGTLASAALGNAGLRFFCPLDAALIVIVWQFGTVLAVTAAAMLVKERLVPPQRTVQATS